MGVSKATTGGPGSSPLFKSFISFPYINKKIYPFMSFNFLSFFIFLVISILCLFIFMYFALLFPFILISWCLHFLLCLFMFFISLYFPFVFVSFLFISLSFPFMFFHFFLFSFHFDFIFPFPPSPDFWVLTCSPSFKSGNNQMAHSGPFPWKPSKYSSFCKTFQKGTFCLEPGFLVLTAMAAMAQPVNFGNNQMAHSGPLQWK